MAERKLEGSDERKRINIHESDELEYWAEHLGVSADDLIRAVGNVGPAIEDIEREVGGTRIRNAP